MPPVHCPFCAKDISFMGSAFGVASAPPVAMRSEKLDDAVYNHDLQSFLWERMRERAALYTGMTSEMIAANATGTKRPNREDGSVVLHMMFDRSVTPQGNLIYQNVMSSSATQPAQRPAHTLETLQTQGYVVLEADGRYNIQTVDDVPVGPIWNTLQYWGGERQHHRWHMERPVHASPRRNDCPAFMDDRMCAVQVWFKDDERLHESLVELALECETGLKGAPPAGKIQAIMLG